METKTKTETEPTVVKKCAQCGGTEFSTIAKTDGTNKWNDLVCKRCGGNSMTTHITKPTVEGDKKPLPVKTPPTSSEEEDDSYFGWD